ncbi:hypothetical protein B0H17DRAFT_1103126 [Mycena rosella]|uniref:Uncharacterized protein n=1 Tax=Mycena rosella TaxID=1033263 RepID=A0AAD7G0Y4_MYCRO|nr:hypothetical protein B0H17DRAFT_1103126 [Mycena rosella]
MHPLGHHGSFRALLCNVHASGVGCEFVGIWARRISSVRVCPTASLCLGRHPVSVFAAPPLE